MKAKKLSLDELQKIEGGVDCIALLKVVGILDLFGLPKTIRGIIINLTNCGGGEALANIPIILKK
jgi:bacteriocin-like protein